MDMKSNWRIKKMKGETTSGRKFDWILDRRVNFIIDEGEESSILNQLSEIIRLNPDEISLTHLKDNPIIYLEFEGSSSYPCLCNVNPSEQTMYNLTKCSFKHGVEFTDTPIDVLLNTLMKDRLDTHGDMKFDNLLSSVLNRLIGQQKVLNRFRDWSNGEKYLLYTLLQLHYMDRKNSVVILNHVDGHLHHKHWNRLIDELFNLNPNIQIICLTNSTDMIGDRWRNHILVFDEVNETK